MVLMVVMMVVHNSFFITKVMAAHSVFFVAVRVTRCVDGSSRAVWH
jgi:hypothetical protein